MTKSKNRKIAIFIWFLFVISFFPFLFSGSGILVFLVITLPHAVNHLLINSLVSNKSQILLTIGQLAYALWSLYTFLSVFFWHVDPQGSIAFLLAPIYSIPVMFVIWLVAALINNSRTEA